MYFLTLDHVSHCLAGNIKEPLNVKVVGCQDQFKECSLINLCQKIGQVLNKGVGLQPGVSKKMTPKLQLKIMDLQKICIPGGNVVSPLFLVLIILREWGVILLIIAFLNSR